MEGEGTVSLSLPGSFAPGALYPGDISLGITVGDHHQCGPIQLMSSLILAWSEEAGSLSSRAQSLEGRPGGNTGSPPKPGGCWRWADFISTRGSSQPVPLATAFALTAAVTDSLLSGRLPSPASSTLQVEIFAGVWSQAV